MFLLVGAFSTQCLASLSEGDQAGQVRDQFGALVEALGGAIEDFYFVAGSARFIVLLQIPRHAVGRVIPMLVSAGLATGESLRINRITNDYAALDEQVAAAGHLGIRGLMAD